MNYFAKSLFVLLFSFFAHSLSAQIVATGNNGDYCECLEGIQAEDEYCPPFPCPTPPSDTSSGSNSSNGGTNGSPSGSSNGTGGTTANEFFTMLNDAICNALPQLCDG